MTRPRTLRRFCALLGGVGSLLLGSAEARASDPDPFWGRDKALHFGVSVGLSAGGYALGALVWDKPWQRALGGAAFSLAAGVAKELWDLSGHGDPSWKDLAWDCIGTGVGVSGALAVDVLVMPHSKSGPARTQAALTWRW